jgi:hypothetical protein
MKIGTRVGAIFNTDSQKVYFYGYGKYMGTSIPKEAVGLRANILRQEKRKIPKIKLDNGEIVYDCECWFGPKEKIQRILLLQMKEGRTVQMVSINEIRKKIRDEIKEGGN